MLRRLLLSGSAHGLHTVVSGEQPDELMSVNTTWGARIIGRVDSPEDARLATGAKGSGAHNLLGAGDFIISLNAELIRFQAAVVTEQEVVKAVQLPPVGLHPACHRCLGEALRLHRVPNLIGDDFLDGILFADSEQVFAC